MTVLEISRATVGAFLKELNTMKIDLIAFSSSLTDWHQIETKSHIVWRLLWAVQMLLWDAHRTISSAYAMKQKGNGKKELRRSSRMIFQRKGETMMPCGQPSSISVLKTVLLFSSLPEQEERKLQINFTMRRGHFFSLISPFRIAGCHAASKAFLKSRKA